jgi:hypothetical protein
MNSDRLDLPFAGLIIHETSPLICYGALSVILVFAGQLPGWLAIGPQSAQVALMLAHIVGLGVFVLGQGAFEAAMHNLWGTSVAIRHKLALAEADAVGARFGAFIRSAMGRALLVQLAITAMVGGGAALLLRVAPAAELVLSIGPTLVVCLLGYSILGHALFLCGVLNTLGARWAVVRIISAAIVTTGFYATLAANWWGPLSTPLGLLGGALLLLGLAFGELRGLLREGDCTLYRAF